MKSWSLSYKRQKSVNWEVSHLPKLYKELLLQLQEKGRASTASREDLENLWSKLDVVDSNDHNNVQKRFLSKVRALLQILLKRKAQIKQDISEGKIIVSENSFVKDYNRGDLEKILDILKSILAGRTKMNQTALREYQFITNQVVASVDNSQLLLQIKGILRFLLEDSRRFARSIERGEITVYDNESLANSSVLLQEDSQNLECDNGSDQATIDIPCSLLSNQNFVIPQLYPENTPDLFSSEYQNLLEFSQNNHNMLEEALAMETMNNEVPTDHSYFKVPHPPADLKNKRNDCFTQTQDALAGYFSQFDGDCAADNGSDGSATPDLDLSSYRIDNQKSHKDDTNQSIILEPVVEFKKSTSFNRFESKQIAMMNVNKAEESLDITKLLKKITITEMTSSYKQPTDKNYEEDLIATSLGILEELTEEFRERLEIRQKILRDINSLQF